MSSPPHISADEDIDVKEERRRVMADENDIKDHTKIFYSHEAGLTTYSYSVNVQHVANSGCKLFDEFEVNKI